MLKIDSEMFHNLNEEAIKDNKKDTFVDAFTEFITELDDVDLSDKTKQHLYDIFIKDMNIYFIKKNMRRVIHSENNILSRKIIVRGVENES